MKLARFQAADLTERIGLVVADGIVDLSKHLKNGPAGMLDMIDSWSDYKPLLERLAVQEADIPVDACQLLAPVARPGKIRPRGRVGDEAARQPDVVCKDAHRHQRAAGDDRLAQSIRATGL